MVLIGFPKTPTYPTCHPSYTESPPGEPSTYYAARSRPPSARAVRDAQVTEKIKEIHARNYGVYGVRKVHAELARQGGVTGRPLHCRAADEIRWAARDLTAEGRAHHS